MQCMNIQWIKYYAFMTVLWSRIYDYSANQKYWHFWLLFISRTNFNIKCLLQTKELWNYFSKEEVPAYFLYHISSAKSQIICLS